MKNIVVFLTLWMTGLPISAEPGASTESMRDAITRTEYAFYTRDFNGMRASRDSFRQLANDQELTTLAHYYIAYADYRLALGDLKLDKNQRIELLNSCIAELNLVLDQRSGDADALALQSVCFGIKAGVQPLKAMFFGPRAAKRMRKAKKSDAFNPRVALLEAVSLYHRPGIFGGDKDKALDRFKQATVMFEAQSDAPGLEPAWGEAETYAYIGNIQLEKQDDILARDALEQALLIAPEYDWVRSMLDTIGGATDGQQ